MTFSTNLLKNYMYCFQPWWVTERAEINASTLYWEREATKPSFKPGADEKSWSTCWKESCLSAFPVYSAPAGSPSWGEDVMVYVTDIKQPSLPTPSHCSCICFGLCGPFNCISVHIFSRQLSLFSLLFFRSFLCLLLVLSATSLYESLLQPWYNP